MTTLVKDLTVDDFQSLIINTTKSVIDELIEDISALSSDSYMQSIHTARSEYKSGKTKEFSEIFDV